MLHEDDPAAMFGLLRHLYDSAYDSSSRYYDDKRWNVLVTHAEVFVVAEKYQMQCLQNEVCCNMERIIRGSITHDQFSDINDFVQATRKIVAHTSDNNRARRLMVRTCVMNLRELHQVPSFVLLLQEFGRLGADIISHGDLECGLLGSWLCSKTCDNKQAPVCSECGMPFSVECVWADRHEESWYCSHCEDEMVPVCPKCDEPVEWIERSITG